MHLIIRDPSGLRHEGILLATGRDRLRVTLRSWEDAVQLVLVAGRWTVEGEGAAEIEAFYLPGEQADLGILPPPPSGNLEVTATTAKSAARAGSDTESFAALSDSVLTTHNSSLEQD